MTQEEQYSEMMKNFIRISHFSELVLHDKTYRKAKMILWPLAFILLAYEV